MVPQIVSERELKKKKKKQIKIKYDQNQHSIQTTNHMHGLL